jgi:DNA-binding NarL/FixJ family response regulator
MHGCDGFEFLDWLHTTRQQIPAVVWTGTLNPQEIERGLTLGARGIFTKPVRFEELVTIIGQICGHAEIRETACQTVDAEQAQQ